MEDVQPDPQITAGSVHGEMMTYQWKNFWYQNWVLGSKYRVNSTTELPKSRSTSWINQIFKMKYYHTCINFWVRIKKIKLSWLSLPSGDNLDPVLVSELIPVSFSFSKERRYLLPLDFCIDPKLLVTWERKLASFSQAGRMHFKRLKFMQKMLSGRVPGGNLDARRPLIRSTFRYAQTSLLITNKSSLSPPLLWRNVGKNLHISPRAEDFGHSVDKIAIRWKNAGSWHQKGKKLW